MSIHDEIGDLSGSQIHSWSGERREAIENALVVKPKRSKLVLDRDVSGLNKVVRAAEIARDIYEDTWLEFNSNTFQIAAVRAATIAAVAGGKHALSGGDENKFLIGWYAQTSILVEDVQELAWLSYAFDAGATEADLIEWGVSRFTVAQLKWWQRREGETLLNQHIRAYRNGWGLRLLSNTVRDTYCNLLRFVDKGAFPADAVEALAEPIQQARDLIHFFGESWSSGQKAPEQVPLSEERAKQWAEAFAANLSFIAPDARGRWGYLPPVSLKAGHLRTPADLVARYLDSQGFEPSDVGTKLTEEFFGRKGDRAV